MNCLRSIARTTQRDGDGEVGAAVSDFLRCDAARVGPDAPLDAGKIPLGLRRGGKQTQGIWAKISAGHHGALPGAATGKRCTETARGRCCNRKAGNIATDLTTKRGVCFVQTGGVVREEASRKMEQGKCSAVEQYLVEYIAA